MAKLHLFLVLASFSSLISLALSANPATTGEVNRWCDQTPHPDQCKYFLIHNRRHFAGPKRKSEFKKMATEIALDRAVQAETYTKRLGSRCRNERERAAWADCVKLFEDTISQLNQTLDGKCTQFDSQTWLSSALTNIDTCRTGFVELGNFKNVLPLISNNNVTQLIGNTLALNYNSSVPKQTYKDGFPTWVSTGDRKLLQSTAVTPDLVVAKDGSGNFKTIKEALDAASKRSGSSRFVIHIKRGVYNENLEIGKKLKNIMLVGEGMRNTYISGSRSVGGGSTTFNSATVAVTGDGFIAQGITFRNTAGPENHQAVALRSGADLSVFYRCGFEGYQDTLYAHSQRQFYKECYIYGTVDFIFGNAAVVFQNCMIYARKPMDKQKITITAQGRTDPNQNTGISIHNSRVMAGSDLKPVLSSFKTFLGRPWKEYSRTVFLQTYMESIVDPAGWLEWDGNFALKTLYYGEYKNSGPGSSTSQRVGWGGYRVITSASEAGQFSVENFIAGRSWLPATNVPFKAGL